MNFQNYRLQVWFSGHVQGVGFRWKTAELAKGYDVCGFVENLDDGRVRLCVKGDRGQIREFVDELSRVMADFIRSKQELEDSCEDIYCGIKIKL